MLEFHVPSTATGPDVDLPEVGWGWGGGGPNLLDWFWRAIKAAALGGTFGRRGDIRTVYMSSWPSPGPCAVVFPLRPELKPSHDPLHLYRTSFHFVVHLKFIVFIVDLHGLT